MTYAGTNGARIEGDVGDPTGGDATARSAQPPADVAGDALRNLGVVEALRCVASYLWARVRPPADQTNLEGWISARFGNEARTLDLGQF